MNRRDFIDKSSLLFPSVLVSPKIIGDLDVKKIKTGASVKTKLSDGSFVSRVEKIDSD